ncbi:MAG: DMT family transporter, partial [Candidatus Thermoplasmatota archaeon]|nr:DMT family transporter [Candidatus Thermoplasmatota archaeon]
AYGAYTVLGKRLSDTVPAVTSILIASGLGALLLAPVALLVEGAPDLAGWSWRAWLNVTYLGLVATAAGFVTYYIAVRFVGIQRTAPALGLVPIFAVLGAALLLGERLTLLHAAGGLLVVLGIVLPGWRSRRSKATPPPGG